MGTKWAQSFRVSKIKKTHTTGTYQIAFLQRFTEAVVQRCSVKNVLLKIPQNSQESTCVQSPFSIMLQA